MVGGAIPPFGRVVVKKRKAMSDEVEEEKSTMKEIYDRTVQFHTYKKKEATLTNRNHAKFREVVVRCHS
jgi:hypothetical protein